MANLEGFMNNFIIIKHDDYDMVTTPSERNTLARVGYKVQDYRERMGKERNPKYLVINTDEPYTDEIIDILKRNGHWG